jgi:hypothetical protein
MTPLVWAVAFQDFLVRYAQFGDERADAPAKIRGILPSALICCEDRKPFPTMQEFQIRSRWSFPQCCVRE